VIKTVPNQGQTVMPNDPIKAARGMFADGPSLNQVLLEERTRERRHKIKMKPCDPRMVKPMSTIMKRLLPLLFAIAVVPFLGGCGKKEEPKRPPPSVRVEKVATVPQMSRTLDLTGETVAVNVVQIASTVVGPIRFCPWREGDKVEKGEKLIEIDRELFRAELKAAEASLAVACAKLDDMKAGTRPEEIFKAQQELREAEENAEFERVDFERTTKLVEVGTLPSKELERSKMKWVAAESKRKGAQRQLEMLEAGFTSTAIAVQKAMVGEETARVAWIQAKVDECSLFAPFSGTVTKVFVREGDMAQEKAALLEMTDFASLVIRCAVPESGAQAVRVGMNAQIRLDSLPGLTYKAEIVRIFPELDRRTRTRIVEITAKGTPDLVPGMFARVRLVLESVSDVISVPAQAIVSSPKGSSVFLASDGKAKQQKVETGIESEGKVQILSGLKDGDSLIVAGQERLKDGAEIKVVGGKETKKNTTPRTEGAKP
jgi:multidrug efflux pump subunit AcrA (membrane-fusion protein)